MSQRVEHIGDATLILGDCLEVLPTLGKVDAVITDPPYGLGISDQLFTGARKRMERSAWDIAPKVDIDAIRAPGAVQIIWGGNYFALPPSRGWLAWFKPDAPPSMASMELAWTNRDKNARQISCSIAQTNPERVNHPAQKPLKVMLWTIEQAGDAKTILDPFMGSGTTGVACAQLGRKFIGIEIEPKYYEIALRRIEDAYRQKPLFEPAPVDVYEQIDLAYATVEQGKP